MGANICVLIGLLVLLLFYNSKFEIQLKCINYKKKIIKRKRDKIQQKSIISRLIIIKILLLIVVFKTENN